QDVFVHDRLTGVTKRVSVDSSGSEADGNSFESAISADGRYVAFTSNSQNLTPVPLFLDGLVFMHDRMTGTTTLVSVDSLGGVVDSAFGPSMSADGRLVEFGHGFGVGSSTADVLVHDVVTGLTTEVDMETSGSGAVDISAAISADGRFMAFSSPSNDL